MVGHKHVISLLIVLTTIYNFNGGVVTSVHAITDVIPGANITTSADNSTLIGLQNVNPNNNKIAPAERQLLPAVNVSANNTTAAAPIATTHSIVLDASPEPAPPTKDAVPIEEASPNEKDGLGSPEKTTSTSTPAPVGTANTTEKSADLPDKGAVEREHNSSMSLFFVLCVIACGILLIHLMLQTGFQYLPESIVVVVLGALIGMFINVLSEGNIANWKREEVFSPTAFFLVLLPPIIFESGYNLHKGEFP